MSLELDWLPKADDFGGSLAHARRESGGERFARLMGLANSRLDFVRTATLDRALREALAQGGAADAQGAMRLAVLASATVDHLLPSIRIAGLRRGLVVECLAAGFGQYQQALLDPGSDLAGFRPDAVLLAIDCTQLPQLPLDASAREVDAALRERVGELAMLWRLARDRFKAIVVQQTVFDRTSPLFGSFERRVPAAPSQVVETFNRLLAEAAAAEAILLADVGAWAARRGVRAVCDPMLWHYAKQEISPAAAPAYGELVVRVLAAARGLSKKCLVLDLDNTLWGGVLGDDGLDGIVIGQGGALGEAYLAFQHYLKRLAERGVALAVSSKNDEELVLRAFSEHPEMALRRDDFAAIVANWDDKPSGVQRIAQELSLGLSALAFFDDNPTERELMRRTLPEVAVPEPPDAVEGYAQCLADAGYFEAAAFTGEDSARTRQYRANAERRRIEARAPDMDAFLRDLDMRLEFAPFDAMNRARVVQLINKTNQFNLTTRRYSDAEVRAVMADPSAITLTLRVKDRFGDNGIVAVAIGRLGARGGRRALEIDTWLMSCRVLGRRLEEATLAELAERARRAGAETIVGRYAPTERNGMVRDLYARLGFSPLGEGLWELPLRREGPVLKLVAAT